MTIEQHIKKSFKRLSEPEYSSEKVWQPKDYEWPGDWEGRALLAITSLNSISDEENEYVHNIVADLKNHVNSQGFLGHEYIEGEVDEQQLAGHTWLVRGLLLYHNLYKSQEAFEYAKRIVYNLYMPIIDAVDTYPLERDMEDDGGVAGHNKLVLSGWRVSTDVGCAFVGLDGLTTYYEQTRDENVRPLIDKLINKFYSIDKVALRAQTHATLTAARSIMRMYLVTKEEKYLEMAKDELEKYLEFGTTATYENYNWFGRPDTWTEPCAVVDSFMLITALADVTGDEKYIKLARRVWFNGLSFCHRKNGGAGTNKCVTETQPVLKIGMIEAYFCCTMRYCDGLVSAKKYSEWFSFDENAEVVKEGGRYFKDDVMLVKSVKDGSTVLITDIEVSPENMDDEYLVFY
ncbi:MAG: hypothetical protein PUF48_02110 [Oscillospiraceae bacterium]|nr:hypothetical protein [Oscillospiraceae bacterium]